MVHIITINEWKPLYHQIMDLEEKGLVTRTFRRLDPERQQAVLSAILEEAIERGPESVNIKNIADRAGVSVGSLYQYFNNREGLLDFTIELTVRYLKETIEQARPEILELPIREGLTAYVECLLEWGKRKSTLIQFFARAAYLGEGTRFHRIVDPISGLLHGSIHQMLERASKRGELRKDIDLESATTFIYTVLTAFVDAQLLPYLNRYYRIPEGKKKTAKVLEDFIDMLIKGIGK